MGDLMTCNVCFLKPRGQSSRLAVTNCGHVLCDACLQKGKKEECGVCRSHCQTIFLSNETSPDIKMLFMDIKVLCNNYSKEFTRVLEFQDSHRRKLLAHYKGKRAKLEETVKELTQQLQSIRSSQSYNQLPPSSTSLNFGPETHRAFSPYSHPVSSQRPNVRPAESVDFASSTPQKKTNFTIAAPTRLSLITSPRERSLETHRAFSPYSHPVSSQRPNVRPAESVDFASSTTQKKTNFTIAAPTRLSLITSPRERSLGQVPHKMNTTGSLRSTGGSLQPNIYHQLSQSASQKDRRGSWNFPSPGVSQLLSQTPASSQSSKLRTPITLSNILQRRH